MVGFDRNQCFFDNILRRKVLQGLVYFSLFFKEVRVIVFFLYHIFM